MVSWPSTDSYVCFAQIHTSNGATGSCSIILMLNYYVSNGLVKAMYRDKDCKTVSTKLGYFKSTEEINWQVKMDGYQMTVSTDKATMTPYNWSWMNTTVPLYFKHGVYVQDTVTDANKDLSWTIKTSALTVTH